jgi:hypothetical protein
MFVAGIIVVPEPESSSPFILVPLDSKIPSEATGRPYSMGPIPMIGGANPDPDVDPEASNPRLSRPPTPPLLPGAI